ncbi:Hypothetical predicted protein [Marmota monax]|nr:Hypothetical predicted protein [Marmota monax]
MTRGAANGRRSWHFGGAGGWAPRLGCLPCSVNEESERRPARLAAPYPGRRRRRRTPEPIPEPTSPGAVPHRAHSSSPTQRAARAAGTRAKGRPAPGHLERCAAGQLWPLQWSCCRRRPARPAPPAPRAPERRARPSSAPTPPPAPRPPALPARLLALPASCPAEAASFGSGPLRTMAPGRSGAGAAVRARLALALALASVLSWPLAVACPTKCTCSAASVDCHGLGLRAVPRGIPRNAERLDLDRNNITRITKTDFAGLKNLRVLHLEDNQVSVIERGAFQDLKQLERLRLNKNKLQVLPELLFQSTPKLTRL